MMTNGQHDELWMNGAASLPKIESDLRFANMIACLKALYEIGEISKEEYMKSLEEILALSGVKLKK